MNNKNIIQIDFLRIFACLLVVLIHSPLPISGIVRSSIWITFFNYISAPCIGLFFMISGYLLLPTSKDIIRFTHARVPRILYPLIFWSLFYLTSSCLRGDVSLKQALLILVQSPFSPTEGFLWYLYALLPLYLCIPILSPWIRKCDKRELQIILIVWGLSLSLPYISSILNLPYYIRGGLL